jgi:hypothetical protein
MEPALYSSMPGHLLGHAHDTDTALLAIPVPPQSHPSGWSCIRHSRRCSRLLTSCQGHSCHERSREGADGAGAALPECGHLSQCGHHASQGGY